MLSDKTNNLLGLKKDKLEKQVKNLMKKKYNIRAPYQITIDDETCTGCGLCTTCDFKSLYMHVEPIIDPLECKNRYRILSKEIVSALFPDEKRQFVKWVRHNDKLCVGCNWCIYICPTNSIKVKSAERVTNHSYWNVNASDNIRRQANTAAKLLVAMGAEGGDREKDKFLPRIIDYLRFDAAQVTNPAIDPLREPMEIKTFLGGKNISEFETKPKQIELETPFMFAHMSYGALSKNALLSLAKAAEKIGIMMGSGEGGLPEFLYPYKDNIIVQVASGRFGVDAEYLNMGRAVSIKIGQGAKPGIGGHLPSKKVNESIAKTRGIPVGTTALSPAPHHDIYSIEDLKQLIFAIKEVTNYKPVEVKVAATHNVGFIACGIARAGADIICIDGYRAGTGAAPQGLRDHTGMDIEVAISVADLALRSEFDGNFTLRDHVSLVASGGVRSSADALKLIMLGADAVSIGTAALHCFGCTTCGACYTNKCNYGICTQKDYLNDRLDVDTNAERIINLITGWSLEIKEFLGSMGISSIESARGNREKLRGLGLDAEIRQLLGVKAL